MSDSSIFDVISDGEESAFSPEPKPKAAAKKAAAPKKPAAAKKTAANGTKAAAKKRPVPVSDDDDSDGGNFSDTPPSAKKRKKAPAPKKPKAAAKPLKSNPNQMNLDDHDEVSDFQEDAASERENSAPSGDKKRAADMYQKLTQLEHILKRPDTYIGSIERSEKQMWVYNSATDSMRWKTVVMVPGLYKIFDEILVNAADNKIRDPTMDTLKVTVEKETNTVSIYNNGRGIPIEIHSKEGVYVPELIFGHLLTSSNYDDDEKKVTGGRNGYGAKLCNIFSTEFTVETADKDTKLKYKQTWTGNMGKMGKAKITQNSKGEEYTKITFKPDLAKFSMETLDDDFEAIIKRRVYDLAGSVKNVKVYLNGERIKIKSFKNYCEMYINALHEENGGGDEKPQIISEVLNNRWEIGFAVSNGNFQQVSFVNSIATTSGGTHVNVIADQLCNKLMELVKKKNKSGAAVKHAQIRNHLFLFVNCLIENPAFTSQTKEQLTTRPSAFGSKCPVSDDFIKKVAKTEIIQNIVEFANLKADKAMKKTDGSRRARINNPKLIDANKAGTKDGHECVLILTEGDSARSLAVAGISAIDGRDRYGVFPLRGKLLNVRDATHEQIMKNVEIQNIKQILGLQHKKVYTSRNELRYGHLMIMTDQDYDGSHIKGLLINFFETQFPSLLRIPHFLIEFITPIVKVFKGPIKKPTKEISFYTMPEYEYWKESNNTKGWEHKYYKGLGTSTEEDAKVYFADLERHRKEFHTMDEEGHNLIELAFSKKKADERKEWLRLFKPGTYLDHSMDKISYPEFVNKELILFSMADNVRSIPSVVDGLKPGQRKILFACFKRNLKKQVKVAQLAGYVSEHTAYQHGEQSLQSTIINMAQTFVGTNNVNLLEPEGSFGTRLDGGKDAASARYIYTLLSPFARKLFPALDDPLLTYNLDDEARIEPNWYVPVVPLVLINGSDGIGTGWSSTIPNYNPEDVVANLRRLMNNEELEPMTPWYRDWTGTIEKIADDKFKFTGIINQIDDLHVEIRELPIKMWTQDFKEKLEEIIKSEKGSFIKDYVDYNSPRKVHFIITMESQKYMKEALQEGLVNKFKLSKTVATTNLVAFDPEGRITKYNTVDDIMKTFYYVRLKYYQERKEYVLADLNKQLLKLSNQARFIQMIINKELVVSGKKRDAIIAELKQKGFDTFSKKKEAEQAGEMQPVVEDEEEEADGESVGDGYNYLLGMAIWSLTREKVDKLLKDVANKEEEIDDLIKKSPKDLWSADLDAFLEEWHRQLEEDKRRADTVVKKKRNGKLAKRNKKKAGSDDDSDDAFVPTKATKKAPPIKKPLLVKTESGDEANQRKGKKALKEESDDEDFDMFLAAAKPKAAPPAKGHMAKDPPAATAATKPAPKPKSEDKDDASIFSMDDDEDFMKIAAATKTNGPAKKTAAAKKAVPAKKASEKPAPKQKDEEVASIFSTDDDVDFGSKSAPTKAVAKPAATKKAAPVKAKAKLIDLMDSDNDSDVISTKAPSKAPTTKSSSTTAAKKAPAPKKTAAKPAAKPAAKSKAKQIVDLSDEDVMDVDRMADELLDSDKDEASPEPVRSRPARGAARAAASKVNYKIADESDEDKDEDSEGYEDDDSE